jgi:3-dehydroquinate dehydratase
MASQSQSTGAQNAFKVDLIQANLETAIAFAKLALQSDDEKEIIRHRQKACEAYEEALHSLSTAALTHIELESIRTKMAHLETVLMGSGQSF